MSDIAAAAQERKAKRGLLIVPPRIASQLPDQDRITASLRGDRSRLVT